METKKKKLNSGKSAIEKEKSKNELKDEINKLHKQISDILKKKEKN